MISALFFDVLGTPADWRRSVSAMPRPNRPGYRFRAFADTWRRIPAPSMQRSASRRAYAAGHAASRISRASFPVSGSSAGRGSAGDLHLARLDAWPDGSQPWRLHARYRPLPCRMAISHGPPLAPRASGTPCRRRNREPTSRIRDPSGQRADLDPSPYDGGREFFRPRGCRCLRPRIAHVARLDEHGPGTGEAKPLVPSIPRRGFGRIGGYVERMTFVIEPRRSGRTASPANLGPPRPSRGRRLHALARPEIEIVYASDRLALFKVQRYACPCRRAPPPLLMSRPGSQRGWRAARLGDASAPGAARPGALSS